MNTAEAETGQKQEAKFHDGTRAGLGSGWRCHEGQPNHPIHEEESTHCGPVLHAALPWVNVRVTRVAARSPAVRAENRRRSP
mgnify:CR=1 FL=1